MKTTILSIFMAVAAMINAQNLVKDGGFTTTPSGNFSSSNEGNNIDYHAARAKWGAVLSIVDDKIVMGIKDGYAFIANNSETNASVWQKCFIYQRFPKAAFDVSKTYKVTFRMKANKPGVNAGVMLKTRIANKFATRVDATEYPGALRVNNVPTEWTTYSDTFTLKKTISTFIKAAPVNEIEMTSGEINDMFIGIYIDNQKGVEVCIDDINIEVIN